MHEVMRVSTLLLALVLASSYNTCRRAKPDAAPLTSAVATDKPATAAPATSAQAKVDFATQVRPILESGCTPCHFAGGTLYQRLPFDRPETIKTLGAKLFTRLKDENDRRLIREFLAQQSDNSPTPP